MGFLTDNFDRINVKNKLSMINDQFMQGVGGKVKKNLDRISGFRVIQDIKNENI